MKKLFFVILGLALTSQLFAQSNPVYVVFTRHRADYAGIQSHIDDDYNAGLYRYLTRSYTIMSRPANYFFKFSYHNRKSEPDNPIISKPSSFLDTAPNVIDWDVIGPTLTKAQAEAKRDEILSHSPIYFIDRKETVNGTIKMVPVGLMKSAW